MGVKNDNSEERIKELEEKIRRLEKLEEEKGAEEAEGIAGGLLREVGGMFGLGGLLKGLEKSPAFQERLKAIDEEVERRLRETPLKRVEEGAPRVQRSFSFRTLAEEEPFVEKAEPVRRKVKKKPAPKEPTVKEPVIDVFEEEDHLKVIAEMPGVEEKDIKVDLQGDKLTISTAAPRRYYREVTLPYPPQGEVKKGYKSGILELRLEKG